MGKGLAGWNIEGRILDGHVVISARWANEPGEEKQSINAIGEIQLEGMQYKLTRGYERYSIARTK